MPTASFPRDRLARAAFWLAPGLGAGFFSQGRVGWGVASMAALHLPLVAGTLAAGSPWFGPVLRRVPSDEWLLTIDDGPDPQDTPRLLDLLDRRGRRALFFFVGQKAAAHPALVAEVAAAGHGVGNHTWSHPAGRWWAVTSAQATAEIERCQGVLGDLLGDAPEWFRAPVGMANPWVHAAARRAGLQVMGWNVRGFDGSPRPLAVVMESLRQGVQRRGRAGAIVLLHEGHTHRPYRAETLLGRVLDLLDGEEDAVWQDNAPASVGNR